MGALSLIVVINLLNRFVMGKSASKLSPEKLEEYLQKTAFSESEVRMWHKYFMNDYPEGKMTQDQFVDVYRLFHPDGKPEQFAMHVFRVFDRGNKGHLTFDDFLLSLNVTARDPAAETAQEPLNNSVPTSATHLGNYPAAET